MSKYFTEIELTWQVNDQIERNLKDCTNAAQTVNPRDQMITLSAVTSSSLSTTVGTNYISVLKSA